MMSEEQRQALGSYERSGVAHRHLDFGGDVGMHGLIVLTEEGIDIWVSGELILAGASKGEVRRLNEALTRFLG